MIRPHLASTALDVVIFYSSGLFNSVISLMISKTSLGIVKQATIKARYSIVDPFKNHVERITHHQHRPPSNQRTS